jgi:putative hydrolase of the HAD superfamily
MGDPILQRIRALSRPLLPEPAGIPACLVPIPGIRAVLVDVYGTLVVSASGEVGTAGATPAADALEAAFAAAGFSGDLPRAAASGTELMTRNILRAHEQSRARGVDYPEVDIRQVWRDVLAHLRVENRLSFPTHARPEEPLAVEYECRVNPTWPMPGSEETMQALRGRGLRLGVVSNAQFYTPLVLEALWGRPVEQAGFDPELCVWSFEQGAAKPSDVLFRIALTRLQEAHGIPPAETLYIGNDLLNDVAPAQRLGCRTVLFAGDRRSLRERMDDPRCAGVRPDAVIAQWTDLAGVLT